MNKNTIEIEKFKALPDTSIYGRLGKVGYNLRDAISELIDNSIDARIPGKKLKIELNLDEFTKEVTIKDNGIGMTKEQARDAIILGKSTKTEKLGFFGLGLKTAALSLGNIFVIKTKQKDSREEHLIEFDKNEFERLNNWELSIKCYPSNNDFGSGTEITISDLLFNPTYKKSDRLNEYFAERYRSFINSGEIEIFVEGIRCEPTNIKYVVEEPIYLETEEGHKITGTLRIQTKRLQKHQEYGFNLYRNKRIIEPFSKIGVGVHGEKALICGELNFDFCPVNFTKNKFLEQSDEYKAAKKALTEYLKPLIPLFITKNLDKDKIEKLLSYQDETGKVPNLNEFKELVKSLNREESISSSVTYNSEVSPELTREIVNEEPTAISRYMELFSQISNHLSYIEETSKIVDSCKTDKETINEINSDAMAEMKLSSYSQSLIDLAKKIQALLRKDNPQKIVREFNIDAVEI